MSEFHKDVVSADGVSSTPHRHGFDWWTSLGRVLASVEAVRDGRALYVLLAAFVGAGLALAAARASLGRQELNWAIGQGAAALFVAFYGAQAAGLLLMDRAMGQAPREVGDALARVGILLHDHLIVSRRGHTSFRQLGLLEEKRGR